MTDLQILYNDVPVLEKDGWRVLCPNMYGKKYKNLKNPILIHKRAEYSKNPEGEKWSNLTLPARPEGNPHCGYCDVPVPDEIQGLLAMYYWDSHDTPELPPAGNSCTFGNK